MKSYPLVPDALNSSHNDLVKEFYEPCLMWAKQYDRGVGYFTSGWLKCNARGMASFASNGGKARWIVSPLIDEKDFEAFVASLEPSLQYEKYQQILGQNVDLLVKEMEKETLNVLAWLIYDNIIEFKFAVPSAKLIGDFHDKFGIFYGDEDTALSFNGSINDSSKGYTNYESIKVFKTWSGLSHFVEYDKKRFELLWNNLDPNIIVYSLPEAIKKQILINRIQDRPYIIPASQSAKWKHQDEAVQQFLVSKNGVLEMATGTGKTRTAIKIICKLFSLKEIKSIVVTAYGNDLLDQWYRELSLETSMNVYRYYKSFNELSSYLLNTEGAIMLVSRDADRLNEVVRFLDSSVQDMLFVCDEVHGFGSPSLVNSLSGKIKHFKYRLGLSATPEREYDEEGNKFIENEIGTVLFVFQIEDAIKKGILCEFDYFPLHFELTEEDKKEMKRIFAAFNAKKKQGLHVDVNDLYNELAGVKKKSCAKLPVFRNFISKRPDLLERSIIFVATKEFGIDLQKILIDYKPDYHTYYGEDDSTNLLRFSRGEIDCLITSKRLSEGIDIKSITSIFLLSSDRARLQTIQRIGRSLRIDADNQYKKAKVIDFICLDGSKEYNADTEREVWLSTLANTRRDSK